MTTLVAGGAGFIGSHLCDRLIAQGEPVICIDNLSTGRRSNIDHLFRDLRFAFVHHDLVDPLPELPPLDRIYHLASPASPPAYQRAPVETLRVNSEGTRQLLDRARQDGARLLFASTSEIYGDPVEHPQRESYRGNVNPIGPRSMYDEAKRYGEAITMAYGRAHGVESRIVRIFNTYGPRMAPDDGRVITNLIVQALHNEPLTIYGQGLQTRSFQYIDDLIDGLILLMEGTYREPVNIGNPHEYTVLELAGLIRNLTCTSAPLVFRPLPDDDPRLRRPDISLARAVLGWEPRVAVIDGLQRTIAAMRCELGLPVEHDPAYLTSQQPRSMLQQLATFD